MTHKTFLPNNDSMAQVISELDYHTFTLNWLTEINNSSAAGAADISSFFFNSTGQKLVKFQFNIKSVHHLLSSVGVKTIVARFAIVNTYEPYGITTPTFIIILFGADTLGNRCSAYYIGKPLYDYDVTLANATTVNVNDCISDKLALAWINNWKIAEVDQAIFDTSYGYLQGYNYLMSDFMGTLYPLNLTTEISDVMLMLVAHDHISHTPGVAPAMVYTFGMVLAGIIPSSQSSSGLLGDTGTQVSTYYDLSLPSPPIINN